MAGKPEGKALLGRPGGRWDNIIIYLKETVWGGVGRIHKVLDRKKLWCYCKQGSTKCEQFPDRVMNCLTYASETRVLKENMTNKLKTFERKIMRKIFGPTRTDDGYWRIKTNQEINDILKGKNIIGFIKKQRLNWLGHVERMAEDNIVQKIKRWETMSKRPIGRPKTRWEDDVLEDIKSINISNWKKVVQNRDSWKKVVALCNALSCYLM